jgi:hypothetical protein
MSDVGQICMACHVSRKLHALARPLWGHLYLHDEQETIVVGFMVPYKITWYGLQLFHSGVLVYSVALQLVS